MAKRKKKEKKDNKGSRLLLGSFLGKKEKERKAKPIPKDVVATAPLETADEKSKNRKRKLLAGVIAFAILTVAVLGIGVTSVWRKMPGDFHTVRHLRASDGESILDTYLTTSDSVKEVEILSKGTWVSEEESAPETMVSIVVLGGDPTAKEYKATAQEWKVDKKTGEVTSQPYTERVNAAGYLRHHAAKHLAESLAESGIYQETTEVGNCLIICTGPYASEITAELSYVIREDPAGSADEYMVRLKKAYIGKIGEEVPQ